MTAAKEGTEKKTEKFSEGIYPESARVIREALPRIIVSIGTAILIWVFGTLVFIPLSKRIKFMRYPVPPIIDFVITVVLAVIIFTAIFDLQKLTKGIAGVLAHHYGKNDGEALYESYQNYKTTLDGLFSIIVVAIMFLLFSSYLELIHPEIPAIILIGIVIWAIYVLWRSCRSIAAEVGRAVSAWAEKQEKYEKVEGE